MTITGRIFKLGDNLKKINDGYVGFINNEEVFATENLGKDLPILTLDPMSMNDLFSIRVSVIVEGQCNCPCHSGNARHIVACCKPTVRLNTGVTSDGKHLVQFKQI